MGPVKRLESISEYAKLEKEPLLVIFKHSTACGRSERARREALAFLDARPDVEIYEVRVIEHRDLSDHIERATGIRHESPQILVLREGVLHWHGSHGSVTAEAIAAAVA
jgi:bacillithiol system protein YtxJ